MKCIVNTPPIPIQKKKACPWRETIQIDAHLFSRNQFPYRKTKGDQGGETQSQVVTWDEPDARVKYTWIQWVSQPL